MKGSLHSDHHSLAAAHFPPPPWYDGFVQNAFFYFFRLDPGCFHLPEYRIDNRYKDRSGEHYESRKAKKSSGL